MRSGGGEKFSILCPRERKQRREQQDDFSCMCKKLSFMLKRGKVRGEEGVQERGGEERSQSGNLCQQERREGERERRRGRRERRQRDTLSLFNNSDHTHGV